MQERYDLDALISLMALETLTVTMATYCAYNEIDHSDLRMEMAATICSVYALAGDSQYQTKHLPAVLERSPNIKNILENTKKALAGKMGITDANLTMVFMLSHLDQYAQESANQIAISQKPAKK